MPRAVDKTQQIGLRVLVTTGCYSRRAAKALSWLFQSSKTKMLCNNIHHAVTGLKGMPYHNELPGFWHDCCWRKLDGECGFFISKGLLNLNGWNGEDICDDIVDELSVISKVDDPEAFIDAVAILSGRADEELAGKPFDPFITTKLEILHAEKLKAGWRMHGLYAKLCDKIAETFREADAN